MKISTRGRYALRLLIDVAENQGEGFVALKDVAERQAISKKYLEQIAPALTSAGILRASKGYMGGYRLNKEPCKITVAAVLKITEGGLAPVACLETDKNYCGRSAECRTLPVWTELHKRIEDYLESVTLQSLLKK